MYSYMPQTRGLWKLLTNILCQIVNAFKNKARSQIMDPTMYIQGCFVIAVYIISNLMNDLTPATLYKQIDFGTIQFTTDVNE